MKYVEASHIYEERILIIDFGSQYTQLIARRVREIGVYCEIYPFNVDPSWIEDFSPSGIILSGGPASATVADGPQIPPIALELGCPVLGICYGMQAMAAQLDGTTEYGEHGEYGYAKVAVHGDSKLLNSIEDHANENGTPLLDVWMSHGDQVTDLPKDFKVIASTEGVPIIGIANESRKIYGLQFHPEVTQTRQGKRILQRFVLDICGCQKLWQSTYIVEAHINNIKSQVGSDNVILGLSGGVDSAITAVLIHKAIGDQLIPVFVDTGLLRQGEPEYLKTTFEANQGIDVVYVDAQDRFLQALEGVEDPEQKRRIIGELFVAIFEEQAQQYDNVQWLAQGTIYPDVIESAGQGSQNSHVIKSHHNVGGLPERMNLQLLEPLKELFKDEVRAIGLELGLPYDRVYRHPFPGPGLAVRILGEVKHEYLTILKQADAIFIEELERWHLYHQASQAFAVFLPLKSVGVRGDVRSYEYVIALRALHTEDYMTANCLFLPEGLLAQVATRITNEVNNVSRVVYDISSKPPATIEWE